MHIFTYIAYDTHGARQSGSVRAANTSQAYHDLTTNGFTPITLSREQYSGWRGGSHKGHVQDFYSSLEDLLNSGVPLERSLLIIKSTVRHSGFHEVLKDIHTEVTSGTSFAKALSHHPALFGPTSIRMIHAAIEGNFLASACKEIAALQQHNANIRRELIAASAYPAFLVMATFGISLLLLTYFVPQFIPLFEDLATAGQLPMSTRMLITASNMIRGHIVASFALALASAWGSIALYKQHCVRRFLFKRLTNMPLFGRLHLEIGLSRLSSMLSALLTNGITLETALRLCRGTIGHPQLEIVLNDASASVQQGGRLSACFREASFVPRDFVETLSIAEASNRMAHTLKRSAEKYKDSSSRTLSVLSKLSEPCLLLLMGGLIGLFVLSLLQPLMNASASL